MAAAIGEKAQDRRRGLLDRAPGHIDARPIVAGAELARVQRARRILLKGGIVLALSNFVAVLNMTIANVTVPNIAGALGAEPLARCDTDARPRGWTSANAQTGWSPPGAETRMRIRDPAR